MAEVREDWLKLTREETLEPDLPICDAHHHLWYEPGHTYTLENYLQDISGGHKIIKTIFIESKMMQRDQGSEELKPVGETEFVQALASSPVKPGQTDVAAGIIGFADLSLGQSIAPVLEAHLKAGKGRFRGVRYTTARDKYGLIKSRSVIPAGIMADAKFREGFACLGQYSLSFDAWLFHNQIPELIDLATAFPDIPIVLDHIGGPLGTGYYSGKRETAFSEWKPEIAALAKCPNVFLKLGGLGMEINGFNWYDFPAPPGSQELSRAYAPYFLYCIEQFGVGRCMFESNFPVEKRSYPFMVIWNAFKRLTREFSAAERKALFYDTACKFYRI